MAELVATDGDGVEHIVWMQEKDDTCGPACCYMIESMLRQQSLRGGEERVVFLTSLLPNGYSEGNGTASYQALKTVLNQAGVPAAASHVTSMGDFIRDTAVFPFITRVGWPNGGGHFVVATRITSARGLVCLDPWYGLVQTLMANMPAYSVMVDYRSMTSPTEVIGGTLSGHCIYPNASPAGGY